MTWSNDEQNMLTGDDMGVIKYWNKEMANIARIDPAHEAGIRAISTSPVDNKFASCGDDHKVMIWDYNTQQRETTINQGNDVKTVDWHPQKGLLVCGADDMLVAPGAARALADAGGFAFEELTGAAHAVPVELPTEWRRTTLAFLDK